MADMQRIRDLQASIDVQRGVVEVCEQNIAQGVDELAGVDLIEERDRARAVIAYWKTKLKERGR